MSLVFDELPEVVGVAEGEGTGSKSVVVEPAGLLPEMVVYSLQYCE